MKKTKLLTSVLAGTMAVSMLLTGCSKKDKQPTAVVDDGKPTEINMMVSFASNEACPDDDPVKKKLEEITNTKLNIQWVPANTWKDKMDVTLASGKLPDLFEISYNDAQFLKLVKRNTFWDVKPFINAKDYPNLAGLPKEGWEVTKIGGKNYGVPSSSFGVIGGEHFPQIREDWRQNVGAKIPETMDDLYNLMKDFATKDPDKNGKADTIGLSGYTDVEHMGGFGWIEGVFNHQPGGWKVVNGKLTNTTYLKGTRDALEWLAKAYKEGLIPKDFATMKESHMKDYVTQGKAGVWVGSFANAWRLTSQIREGGIAAADLRPLEYMISGDNKKYAPLNVQTNLQVIPKSVPEAKMKKILKFVDYIRSLEGYRLTKFGFEGQHYKIENGQVVALVQEKDLKSTNLSGFAGFYDKYSRAFTAGVEKNFYERSKKIIDERLKYAVINIGAMYVSETGVKIGRDYSKKIQDVKTQIIMGKIPITAWDDLVAKLKADPEYTKIDKEMDEAYQANK